MKQKSFPTLALAVLCVMSVVVAQAQRLTQTETRLIANRYLKQCGATGYTQDGSFYIFSDTVSRAFVIVSGDRRMKPVLGCCDHAEFDPEHVPAALRDLMQQWQEQYEWVQTHEPELTGDAVAEAPDVAPMLATTWGQSSPFNDLCPSGTPSGCVATAMAQIMRHYGYPAKGSGAFSYTSRTRKHRCSFDFGSATFDWTAMQDSYATKGTQQQNHAVAELMYACGVSVGMDYAPSGSGAYGADVPYALINYFSYNPNTVYYYRPYYKAGEWYGMVYAELSAGRPVLYCGSDTKVGGHAFVVDGSRAGDGKVHVNWGWDSDYDGWYELDALDPGKYRFATYQSMVARFSPETVGEHEDMFYAEKFVLNGKFSIGSSAKFELADVYCFASDAQYVNAKAQFNGQIGLGLFDEHCNYIRTLSVSELEPLNALYGYSKLTLQLKADTSLLADDGTFYIMPIVKNLQSTLPTRIRTQGGKTDGYKFVVQNGCFGEGGEDIGDLDDPVAQWAQDFETPRLPSSWEQTQTQGCGSWVLATPLTESSRLPKPSSGKSYVYLDFAATGIINATMSATRLTSDFISLYPDSLYTLRIDYRKYTTNAEAHDVLVVYALDSNGVWTQQAEQQVTNTEQWNTLSVDLKGNACVKLSFEGSVSRGSRLFIDNIRLIQQHRQSPRGDLTGDGVVDVDDLNLVINMMLHKADVTEAADLNGDGAIDVDDLNAIINIMLRKDS